MESRAPRRWRHPLLMRGRPVVAALSALLIGTGALVGYLLGVRTPTVATVTITVYVGDRQASGEVEGWWYGVRSTVSTWRGADGSKHEGGWPTCLDHVGSERTVIFGWVPAIAPGGGSWRDVVYVACP
ncbi:MAG: hypothetical protein M0027_11075 [Candidatus Dormibacteraeota bacterium]|nr:hypothetical protein [Candidatus Dormibacteraeota bacterium]